MIVYHLTWLFEGGDDWEEQYFTNKQQALRAARDVCRDESWTEFGLMRLCRHEFPYNKKGFVAFLNGTATKVEPMIDTFKDVHHRSLLGLRIRRLVQPDSRKCTWGAA